jgi:hypothetical protein
MVRNGFGCGEVKFARTFLDWRYVRSFSALSEESNSTKHKLGELNDAQQEQGKEIGGNPVRRWERRVYPLDFPFTLCSEKVISLTSCCIPTAAAQRRISSSLVHYFINNHTYTHIPNEDH